MSSIGKVNNPGGPGLGLYPGEVIISAYARGAAATYGQTFILDLPAGDTATDSAVGPGLINSPFANMRAVTTNVGRDRRIGIWGVCMEPDGIADDDFGRWLFRGVRGTTSTAAVDDSNPADGIIVEFATAPLNAGSGLVWDGTSGNPHLADESVTGAAQFAKVIGINLIPQTDTGDNATPILSAVWFDGLDGFGTTISGT